MICLQISESEREVKAGIKDRITEWLREKGKQWGRSIVECFFSTVMMKYGVSRSGA